MAHYNAERKTQKYLTKIILFFFSVFAEIHLRIRFLWDYPHAYTNWSLKYTFVQYSGVCYIERCYNEHSRYKECGGILSADVARACA